MQIGLPPSSRRSLSRTVSSRSPPRKGYRLGRIVTLQALTLFAYWKSSIESGLGIVVDRSELEERERGPQRGRKNFFPCLRLFTCMMVSRLLLITSARCSSIINQNWKNRKHCSGVRDGASGLDSAEYCRRSNNRTGGRWFGLEIGIGISFELYKKQKMKLLNPQLVLCV